MKNFLTLVALFFVSCSSPTSNENQTVYDTISVAFEGYPDTKDVQNLTESVLSQCNMPATHDNIMHLANGLVEMRQQSKVGVTEMEILKHMYQHGTSNNLATRLATSASILETTK